MPAPGHRTRPAANYDIALSDAFWHAMTGLVHAFALATTEGITTADRVPYAEESAAVLPDIIDGTARQVCAGDYPGDGSEAVQPARDSPGPAE